VRLETERLVLREFVEADARTFHAIESDPAVSRYLTSLNGTIESAQQYVASIIVAGLMTPRLVYDFAITERGSDAAIGRCGMKRGESEVREAMLWYVLAPAHHGKGYVTEAVRALVGFAFETLQLHRVYADIDPRNPASVRVCERLGMRREAHHVDNLWFHDEWCDSLIYAMLHREWRP
jgi:RimJ/RimL family protein N-acetyltransferase